MGRVFSWSEVEQRKVPHAASFSKVVSRIRHDLEATEGVVGGILCGSLLWNCCTPRSDIDCVVVYDPEKRREVMAVLQRINQEAAELYVPVDMIPVDSQMAGTPMHHIGLSFATHLRYAARNGGLVKQNPLSLFLFDEGNAKEDIRGYLRNKLRMLDEGTSRFSAMEEAEFHRFLQKMLEAPLHIARKMLWWQKVDTPDDSKQAVLCHYPRIAEARERKLFERVNATDSRYTRVLLAQLQRHNRDQYARVIEEIRGLAWDTLEFVRLNALRFT